MIVHAAIGAACATMGAWEDRSSDSALALLHIGRNVMLGPGAVAPTYTLTNVPSNELQGSSFNYVTGFSVASDAGAPGLDLDIRAVRWRADLTTFGTSWLSDFAFRLWSSDFQDDEFVFQPAAGSDFPGSGVFDSNGWVYLPQPIDMVGGVVRIEFFETYNDAVFATDGMWNSLEIQFMTDLVPSPGGVGMAAVGLVFALRRRR